MAAPRDVPIFDADNHRYEDRDAFTKFLPDKYKSAVQFVDIAGRTKIMVKNTVSEYIPNPTFDVVARPDTFIADLQAIGATDEQIRKFMGGNLANIMGIPAGV